MNINYVYVVLKYLPKKDMNKYFVKSSRSTLKKKKCANNLIFWRNIYIYYELSKKKKNDRTQEIQVHI